MESFDVPSLCRAPFLSLRGRVSQPIITRVALSSTSPLVDTSVSHTDTTPITPLQSDCLLIRLVCPTVYVRLPG